MSLTKVSYSMISGAPVSVLDYGATGDGVTNDNAAVLAAVAAATAAGRPLYFPAGTYLLNAGGSINFAASNFHIFGDGAESVLKFTGSGIGFNLAGGVSGNGLGGMIVENLLIEGNPSVTDGFYSAGVVRSFFRCIEVRECSAKAFHIKHGVSNQYDSLKFSTNDVPQTTTPTYGLYLDNNGLGYYTADCTFVNTVIEGFTGTACLINDASGNIFVGGTFEGMTGKGLEINTDECRRNAFHNVWFEANTVNDAIVRGVNNSFENCYFGSASSSPTVDIPTGTGTQFIGGFLRVCNLQLAGSNTSFVGVTFSDNVALGITGTGSNFNSYTRVGCTRADTNLDITSKYIDNVGDVGSWTPTVTQGSAVTATITSARFVRVGRLVTLRANLTFTSAGTGGSAIVIGGIPSSLAAESSLVDITAGTATFNFAGTRSVASAKFQSTSQLTFFVQGGTNLLGVNPATAIANTDTLSFTVTYESSAE